MRTYKPRYSVGGSSVTTSRNAGKVEGPVGRTRRPGGREPPGDAPTDLKGAQGPEKVLRARVLDNRLNGPNVKTSWTRKRTSHKRCWSNIIIKNETGKFFIWIMLYKLKINLRI